MAERIKNLRFAEMDESGAWVRDELEVFKKILQEYAVFSDGHLEGYCLDFLCSKSGGQPLRAYFFRKLWEYIHFYQKENQSPPNPNDLFTKKLPFVFEVVMVIQYLHNQILDEKYRVKKTNHVKTSQNLVSSNILREILHLYIKKEVAPLLASPAQVSLIEETLRRLLLWVDIGQYMDKEYNHYGRWKDGLTPCSPQSPLFDATIENFLKPFVAEVQKDLPGKEDFVEGYFRRIYLSNVYFFRGMAELALELTGYKGGEQRRLVEFSISYGFMLQIINDYADFAYTEDKKERDKLGTSAKSGDDFFSDLYNFNITLPLIYHLKEGAKRKIESYLEGGRKQKKLLHWYPQQIKKEIVDSGGIEAAKDSSKSLSKIAAMCLDPNNPATPYLEHMCQMAFGNKYIDNFNF